MGYPSSKGFVLKRSEGKRLTPQEGSKISYTERKEPFLRATHAGWTPQPGPPLRAHRSALTSRQDASRYDWRSLRGRQEQRMIQSWPTRRPRLLVFIELENDFILLDESLSVSLLFDVTIMASQITNLFHERCIFLSYGLVHIQQLVQIPLELGGMKQSKPKARPCTSFSSRIPPLPDLGYPAPRLHCGLAARQGYD